VKEEDDHPAPKFSYVPITNLQIQWLILHLGPYKAPGANGIANVVFQNCMALLIPHLGLIYRDTFALKVYPKQWKDSNTVILRKPSKPDNTAKCTPANSTAMAKILSACVSEDHVHMAELHRLLPDNHFGCRLGRPTMDKLQP